MLNYFQHINLTNDQLNALAKIQDFLQSDEDVFILQGYAGSGKTTMIKGLVEYLHELKRKYQLMAPTGRAAKVINQKTGFEATTIHKGIYSFHDLEEIEINEEDGTGVSFLYYYKICNNPEVLNSVLIVDEASMVSDFENQGEFFRFGSGYLLKDLIEYSHIGRSKSATKIIFVGDPAQLPPVGMNFSPALDKQYLESTYKLKVVETEMKEVIRQDSFNGILKSATKIRRCLTSGFFNDFDLRADGLDILNPKFSDFLTTYKKRSGTKIIISYKNKTAYDLNKTIRQDKFGKDIPIQKNDIIIVGGNNYRLGIMNGEFGVISDADSNTITREVRFRIKNKGTASVLLTWRYIEILMPDEKETNKSVKGYLLENFLHSDNELESEEKKALYIDFKNRFPELKPGTAEFKEAIKTDPFFNCILVKYGYAVTCHKAQGGEWDSTFVFWDKGVNENFNFFDSEHNRTGKTNPEFYRWAYTAITRASETLFCINPPYFNSFSGMYFVESSLQDTLDRLTGKSSETEMIEISEEHIKLLQAFGLVNEPIPLQNHFLRIYYILHQHYIDIIKWNKVGYEIRYAFKREDETASFKFWINGQYEFRNNFQILPAETNSDLLFREISDVIENAPKIGFVRNNTLSILSQIEFEIKIEEERPFLKVLCDSLQSVLASSQIAVAEINRQNYRERYSFECGNEKAMVDFIYNDKGFFGQVSPIDSHCNSERLLKKIVLAVSQLKASDHVI